MNSELALIRYNLRCKLYHSAAEEANKCLKGKGKGVGGGKGKTGSSSISNTTSNTSSGMSSKNRGIWLFWRACSIGLSGKYRHALKDLRAMRKNHRYLDHAILSALIWFHQKAQVSDIEHDLEESGTYMKTTRWDDHGNDDDGNDNDNDNGDNDDSDEELEKWTIALQAAKDCNVHMDDGALLAAEFHFYVGEYNEAQSCLNTIRGGGDSGSSRMGSVASSFSGGGVGGGGAVVPTIGSNKKSHADLFQQDIHRMTLWLETMSITARGSSRERSEMSSATADHLILLLQSSNDIDCLMAQARYYTIRGDISTTLEVLNKVIASDDMFFPAYIERAKIQLQSMNFKAALESAQLGHEYSSTNRRGSSNNSNKTIHLESLRILTLAQYLCGGEDDDGDDMRLANLGRIASFVEKEEHPVVDFCYETSKLFSQICNRDPRTLEITLSLMAKISNSTGEAMNVMMNDHHHTFQLEYARQLQCLGRYKDAMAKYHLASELDQSDTDALQGLIVCQILAGDVEEAKEQLEFLSLMEDEDTNGVDLLHAKVLLNRGELMDEVENAEEENPFHQLIKTALDIFSKHENRNPVEFYSSFDVGFFIGMIKQFVRSFDFDSFSSSMDDVINNRHTSEMVDDVLKLLCCVVERYPYLDEAYILHAKIKADLNQLSASEHVIHTCLCRCPKSKDALIYRAQLQMQLGNEPGAEQSLAEALSLDFGIQSHPNYCLVKGMLYANNEQNAEAGEALRKVIRHAENAKDECILMSRLDIISAFSSMGKVLKNIGQDVELSKLLSLAERLFGGSQTFRLLSFKSDMYMKYGETEKALKIYDGFSRDSPHFRAAQMAKANVYLLDHDKERYIQCHRNILTVEKTPQAYLALGDALMTVNSPVDAFEAYNSALKMAPCEQLAVKIGKTMIACHDFKRAVDHFKFYINEFPKSFDLRFHLSSLFLDLENYNEALIIMNSMLESNPDDLKHSTSDASSISEGKFIVLSNIAKAYRCMGNFQAAVESLKKILQEVRRRQSAGNRRKHEKQKYDLMIQLSDCYENNDQLDLAIETSEEVVRISRDNEAALVVLIKQLLKDAQIDVCENYCNHLLSIDPKNEKALLILSEIMMRRSEINQAVSLLEPHSSNYEICFNLLPLYYRVGKRNQATELYGSLISKASGDERIDIGNLVCQGIYHRLIDDPASALVLFHRARRYNRHSNWGHIACLNMIEIYLQVDDFDYWRFLSVAPKISDGTLRSVTSLLKEMKQSSPDSLKVKVLRGYFEIAKSVQTKEFEKPIKHFSASLKSDKEYVPALLGLAIVYNLDSAQSKLRNTLKKVAKLDYNPQHSNEFQRSWLLLSLSYIERGKFDLAHDLCKRSLFYDRSCAKAWEILGRTLDAQGNHGDAISCYEHCVKIDGKGHPGACLQLANHYVQKEKPMAALRVASVALEGNPDFSQISDVIFNDCIPALKP